MFIKTLPCTLLITLLFYDFDIINDQTYWPFGSILGVCSYDITKKDLNLVAYWGQNSYGSSPNADKTKDEKPIGEYCEDETYSALVMSFFTKFNSTFLKDQVSSNNNKTGSVDVSLDSIKSMLSLGKHCYDDKSCELIKSGIKKCQEKGKLILLSLGGYSNDYGLESDAEADNLATLIWDLFLGGNSKVRPFGDDIRLDGVDLDIEKGNPKYYPKFAKKLKEFYDSNNSNKKKYYLTAAPQCPFPDKALSPTLDNSHLDMVFVQFYNNPCEIASKDFNFDKWDEWAKTKSPNKNVRIYVGLPASNTAATTGYIEHSGLKDRIHNISTTYPSFGGIMLWDVSQASQNICPDIKKPYNQAMSLLLKDASNRTNQNLVNQKDLRVDGHKIPLYSIPKFIKKKYQSPNEKLMSVIRPK